MSELQPDGVVEPEPTDADPAPDAIRPDRPRIWPEEPRAPKPQIKRPLEEWLAEFDDRVKLHEGRQAREPVNRRRRPRGLERLIPTVVRPDRGKEAPDEQARRGRRRRRGGDRAGQPANATQPQRRPTPRPAGQAQPPRPPQPARPPRQPGQSPQRPQPGRDRRPNPASPEGGGSAPRPQGEGGDPTRRRRRRGRGRGPRPNGPPRDGGAPPPAG